MSLVRSAVFVAHGIGGIRDLPVPTYLFYWGGAIALVLSFVALGVLWREPLLSRHQEGRPLWPSLPWSTFGRIGRVVLGGVSIALLVLVLIAALAGEKDDPNLNFAPTFVYVVFWLGLPLASFFLGDVWRFLSPWRALADAGVWLRERSGTTVAPLTSYPERLGRWPGAAAYFAFTALELAYTQPSNPRMLAVGVLVYSYWALFGMALFGRETWSENGEGFAIAFRYLARLSPLALVGGRTPGRASPRRRLPLSGLAGTEPRPGSIAFIAVMLGSVGFDGFSRTPTWQNVITDVQVRYAVTNPGLADLLTFLINLGGLLGGVLFVALAYRLACRLARYGTRATRSLEPDFLLGLVPIAFVYAVAHYFSLAVFQTQYMARLISDPLGRGWDLFGTAHVQPDFTVITPTAIWYVQAATLIAGHVAGLAVAHDRAVTVFRDRESAIGSQLPMLGLMVLYTVGGLWILSRG